MATTFNRQPQPEFRKDPIYSDHHVQPKQEMNSSNHKNEIKNNNDYQHKANDIISISQTQLDRDLTEFLKNVFPPQKDKNYVIDAEVLKKMILNLITENANPVRANHQILNTTENEFRNRIAGLEQEKIVYEDKIRSHANYIMELEKKVNQLITEYEKALILNEELSNELEIRKNKNPSPVKLKVEKLDSLIENEMNLFEENTQLKNDLKSVNDKAAILESRLQELEKINIDLRNVNQSLTDQLSLLTEKLSLVESNKGSSTETINKEALDKYIKERNELVNQIQKKDELILSLRAQEEILLKEIDHYKSGSRLDGDKTKESQISYIDLLQKQIQDYHSKNSILQKKIDKYVAQIESLNETLAQTNQNLDLAQNKCITLEKELANKNKLETLIKSHLVMISNLEVKIQNLASENGRLQKLNEENLVLIEELRAQLEEAQTLKLEKEIGKNMENNNLKPPRASEPRNSSPSKNNDSLALEIDFIKKDYEEKIKNAVNQKEMEIAVERINHKNQIEKYNSNLEILSGKIQALVIVNEKLARDHEILKMEFTNYRIIAWSVLQEIRKSLDNFRKYNTEIETELISLGEKIPEAKKLKDIYSELKLHILYVDQLIEDRRKLI